jgi:hypothetical protein
LPWFTPVEIRHASLALTIIFSAIICIFSRNYPSDMVNVVPVQRTEWMSSKDQESATHEADSAIQ